jgi:hypothetical protein
MLLAKCVVWSLQRLDHSISFLPGFLIIGLGFHILGALVGSTSFVELFVARVFHEDLETISSLLMFIDPQAVFVMFLLHYTQCSKYLFHTMFPSLGIL